MLAGELFDGFEFGLFFFRDEADGNAFFAGACGAPDAVDVFFGDGRDVEVDDVGNVLDVNATGGNVGGDEDAGVATAEGVEGIEAGDLILQLALFAQQGGQGFGIVPGIGAGKFRFDGGKTLFAGRDVKDAPRGCRNAG